MGKREGPGGVLHHTRAHTHTVQGGWADRQRTPGEAETGFGRTAQCRTAKHSTQHRAGPTGAAQLRVGSPPHCVTCPSRFGGRWGLRVLLQRVGVGVGANLKVPTAPYSPVSRSAPCLRSRSGVTCQEVLSAGRRYGTHCTAHHEVKLHCTEWLPHPHCAASTLAGRVSGGPTAQLGPPKAHQEPPHGEPDH